MPPPPEKKIKTNLEVPDVVYLNGVYGAYDASRAPCLEEVLLYNHIIHVPEKF